MSTFKTLRELQIDEAWRAFRGNKHTRRFFSKRLRDRLAGEQNWRCCYCGVRMDGEWPNDTSPTLEHVVPRVAGGPDAEENLVVACNKCNRLRGHAITDLHVDAVNAWEGWD